MAGPTLVVLIVIIRHASIRTNREVPKKKICFSLGSAFIEAEGGVANVSQVHCLLVNLKQE